MFSVVSQLFVTQTYFSRRNMFILPFALIFQHEHKALSSSFYKKNELTVTIEVHSPT